MAIILKTGKTYNPDISEMFGVDLSGSNYYGVIDRIEYDKKSKTCYYSVDIYGSKSLRNESASTVGKVNFIVGEEGFETDIGNNGLSVVDAYNKALETLTDWESDE